MSGVEMAPLLASAAINQGLSAGTQALQGQPNVPPQIQQAGLQQQQPAAQQLLAALQQQQQQREAARQQQIMQMLQQAAGGGGLA